MDKFKMSKQKRPSREVHVPEEFRIQTEETIRQFMQNEDETTYSFPPTLTNIERAFIHELAKRLRLKSKSHGKNQDRYLVLTKITTEKRGSDCYLDFTPRTYSHIRALLQAYPMDSRELNDIIPSNIIHRRRATLETTTDIINKTMGRLHFGTPLIPPLPNVNPNFASREALTIYEFKSQLLQTVNSNQVVLVCGETGCGKTTQLPQFILEDAWIKKRECKIICTQPRRLSAVAVAERVAQERGEIVGQTVGYQIRLESRVSVKTLLTYCTNGVLLRSLMTGMNCLKNITHIIVDEVHERDSFCDFLLICLRECLVHNKNIKLILMSATMDMALFSQYFSNPPIIKIPGRLYTVTEYFLEDVLDILNYMTKGMEKAEKDVKKTDNNAEALEGAQSLELMHEQENVQTKSNITLDPQVAVVVDNYLHECWQTGTESSFFQLMHLIMSEHVPVDYQHSQTGITVLMIASLYGNMQFIEQLLNLGANVNLTSNNNKTALDWAVAQGHQEAIELLTVFSNRSFESSSEQPIVKKDNNYRLSLYDRTVRDGFIDYELILELIVYLHLNTHNGSILCFLAGYDDIVTLKNIINDEPRLEKSKIAVFMLHSNMSTINQKQIFQNLGGQRKIILSTNIAETSITIDDVVYVIDAGKVKEKNYDAATGVSCLQQVWIAQSCAKQRAGRAGRTKPGFCFHLFSRARFQSMQIHPTAEIVRMSLQELCLHTKMLAPADMSIEEFLSLALEPPSPLLTKKAIVFLKLLGALDNDEKLTPLGLHLVELCVEPHLGKVILYGVLLKCLDPVLTIVSCLAYRDPFILPPNPVQRRFVNNVRAKLAADSFSDHMTLLRAFQMWQASAYNDRTFCERNFISPANMEMVLSTRMQLVGQLRASGFISTQGSGDLRDLNQNSENWAVIKAALASGLYPNLSFINRHTLKLRTERENRVIFHPSSVLRDSFKSGCTTNFYEKQKLPSEWILFDEISRQGRFCLLRGATIVTPITILMFTGPSYVTQKKLTYDSSDEDDYDDEKDYFAKIELNNWVSFLVTTEHVDEILHLRNKWNALVLRRMHHPLKRLTTSDENIIHCLVECLSAEEQSAGLKQPRGIGQRPHAYIENSSHQECSITYSRSTKKLNNTKMKNKVPNRAIPRQITKQNIQQQPDKFPFRNIGNCFGNEESSSENSFSVDSVLQVDRDLSNLASNLNQMRLNSALKPTQQSQPLFNDKFNLSNSSGYFTYDGNNTLLDDFEFNGRNVSNSDDSSSIVNVRVSDNLNRKYYIIKVPTLHMIDVSITKRTWIFPLRLEQLFLQVLREGVKPILIFTVQGSNHFQGIAELISEPQIMKNRHSVCSVKWISRANLSFQATRHLMNAFNSNRRIHSCPDGQEVDPETGAAICNLFTTIDPEVPLQMDVPSPPKNGRPIRRRMR